MSAVRHWLGVALAIAIVGCGPESPAPGTASNPPPTATEPPLTTAQTAPSATAPVASGSGAPAAPGALAPSDGNVAKLLEGGDALKKLPEQATDKGAAFDPALRGKLAPQRPPKAKD